MVDEGSRSRLTVWAVLVPESLAALDIVTLLFLTGLFSDLPEATLAAVVIAALIELVDIDSLKELFRNYSERLGRIYGVAARPDFIAAVAAMLGVLIFDTLPGLFIGIGISLLLMVFRSSRPHIARLGAIPSTNIYVDTDRRPEAIEPAGVKVLRVESGLFFGNADFVRTHIRSLSSAPDTRAVIIDAETIPFVDVTAVRMLTELAEELEASGVTLLMAQNIGQVRDLTTEHGESDFKPRVYATIEEAIAAVPPVG